MPVDGEDVELLEEALAEKEEVHGSNVSTIQVMCVTFFLF